MMEEKFYMRIVLMINNNSYNNRFVRQLCLSYPSYIKAVIISGKLLPGKKRSYLGSFFYVLKNCGLQLFLLRGVELTIFRIKGYLKYIGFYRNCFDVRYFCFKNKIPVFRCADINAPEFLQKIEGLRPDIVISRINQIIKKDLLAVPVIGIINSHMSLLPKYQGVDSIFWGMVNKDEDFGVTFHFIDENLDSGDIIKQIKLSGLGGKSLYLRESILNEISSFCLVEVVKSLKNCVATSYPMLMKDRSYHSLATRAGYRKFKENGHRLITGSEVMRLLFGDGVKLITRATKVKTKTLIEKEFNKFVLRHEVDYFDPLVECFNEYVNIKGRRILDFGCGSGDLSFLLLEQGAQSVVGVDICQPAIHEAMERVRQQNINNAEFVNGDILKMELPAYSVDLIISHSVLHYINNDWQPILHKLYDALISGGTLIATIEVSARLLTLIQTINLYFLPNVIKERLYLLFKILVLNNSKANDEVMKGKCRYLAIPHLSAKSKAELMVEFARAGFSEVKISDSIKLHKLSMPHLTVVAKKY